MRTRLAMLNVVSSLGAQLVAVICGFIVPAILIGTFGSATYGAICSISQFLGFITLLEAGVGGVTRAALYKPIADRDVAKISAIVRATERFFASIGGVFCFFALAVAVSFPYITSYDGEWVISFGLTLAIASGTLAQYLFGITYSLLFQADQRSFVNNCIQIITLIVNAAVVVLLVLMGFNVLVVEFGSAIVFVARPLILNIYARKRYCLDRTVEPDGSALKNKWNGLGHHLAFFFRSNVSVVALSLFQPMTEVAVFTVFNLVALGLQKIVNAFSSGIEAAFGDMIAKEEDHSLASNFRKYELLSSMMICIFFSVAMVTIQPFVLVYTAGVSDANYSRQVFGILLLLATAVYCFRLPYNSVTLAAGHYRETRNGAFLEAFLAVSLSFVLVYFLGATGSAIALLSATLVRTAQYLCYSSDNILRRKKRVAVKHAMFTVLVLVICYVTGVLETQWIVVAGYIEWIGMACICLANSLVITVAAALLFYREDMMSLVKKLRSIVLSR